MEKLTWRPSHNFPALKAHRPCVQGAASTELYEGLLMLQHRGQDSAGMVTANGPTFHEHKNNGLVKDVFHSKELMDKLAGRRLHVALVGMHQFKCICQGYLLPLRLTVRLQ